MFDVLQEDDEEEAKRKKEDREVVMDWFINVYTDMMVPAVAGVKLFSESVRHSEPMCTSLIPNTNSNRITASTEAFTVLLYKNAWEKWNTQHRWKSMKENQGRAKEMPRYSRKFPDKNREFMTVYSDTGLGQQRYGGWSEEGKIEYGRLQRLAMYARKNHAERCLAEDTACVESLREKYKHKYSNKNSKNKRKRRDNNEPVHENLLWELEE
jgi:hypothetical protein